MAITNEYLELLTKLHNKVESFGKRSKIAESLKTLLNENFIDSILDFGCGKGNTSASLKEQYPNVTVYSYDPVTFPNPLPAQVDLVYSSDVLEHIELDLLEDTLKELFSIGTKYQYHLIACHPAKKLLADGRNAHLIIEEPDWWKDKLLKFKDWEIIYEDIQEWVGTPKKGPPIDVKKYIVILRKK